MLGIEKLALQGIFAEETVLSLCTPKVPLCFAIQFPEDLKDTDFPQKLLGDLAGNAFTTLPA